MTAEDFGGDPMSVSLKEYFDKQFEGLTEELKEFRVEVRGQFGELPCGEYKTIIDKNTQRLDNNVVMEERDLKRAALRQTTWRIVISLIGVGWIVVQLWTKYK